MSLMVVHLYCLSMMHKRLMGMFLKYPSMINRLLSERSETNSLLLISELLLIKQLIKRVINKVMYFSF